MKPENGILEKSRKNGKYLKNIQLGLRKLKSGQNKLFRSLNGSRRERKRDMWVPLKKNNKTKTQSASHGIDRRVREEFFFLIFFLFSYFSNLRKSDRRDKHEKCSTRRGLRVGTKNTGFHREFR